jgi:hypothetical protein
LGLFGAFVPRPTPLGPRPTRRRRELGSFCTIGPSPARRPPRCPILPKFGFVLPRPIECPIYHNSFPAQPLPLLTSCRELALFGAFAPRPAPLRPSSRPAWPGLALFVPPPLTQGRERGARNRLGVGFVWHICPRPWDLVRPGTAGNWVCFTRLASPDAPSSRYPEPPKFGFVWCDCPTAPAGQIGFVLPRSIGCSIHHNSFPGKPLPLLTPWPELALFRRIDSS